MTKTIADIDNNLVRIGEKNLARWPAQQKWKTPGDPTIAVIHFEDIADYHPRLIEKVMELENHPTFGNYLYRGGCGKKVHHIGQWHSPEADLIHARAIKLFSLVLNSPTPVVDACWANISRSGDYCMPHSHHRAIGSVVYCVEPGDEDAGDPLAGRFCFVDPRIASCCQKQAGRVTTPYLPEWRAGTMLIFPGQLVHCVNPYNGATPRITMSWNINHRALAGSAYSEPW